MESAYDRKFTEMKKYIPFLESMIKRLESTSSTSANPRQAQLDKIRSLRDLLLDNKKRMKMENLLKCEQVLVNLYAKVEQREPFPDTNLSTVKESTSKEKSDLETVRNKLKTVVKIHEGIETLPEIARANDIELNYTGSKEPALFQRRPNRSSISPKRPLLNESRSESPQNQTRRSYTRVLVSPDQSPQRWSSSEPSTSEKPLFSRRSPAPIRNKSPSSNKKGKKMSNKSSKLRKTKDLNITLNVPEKSLNSLNTSDILSRIINCSDRDVDIETLRELRSQILGELKQTGKNDDISDLILKSYGKTSKPITKTRRKDDVEEGELSDSESEAIESIYGSLVVVDKDKKALTQVKTIDDKDNQQRKIQICLVINSDESNEVNKGSGKPQTVIDLSEFEMFSESEGNQSKEVISIDSDTSFSSPNKNNSKNMRDKSLDKKNILTASPIKKMTESPKVVTVENDIKADKQPTPETQNIDKYNMHDISQNICLNINKKVDTLLEVTPEKSVKPLDKKDTPTQKKTDSHQKQTADHLPENPEPSQKYTANFYKPIEDSQNSECVNSTVNENISDKNNILDDSKGVSNENNAVGDFVEKNKIEDLTEKNKDDSVEKNKEELQLSSDVKNKEDSQQIPLLNEPILPPKAKTDVLSEIDILQALKNEILSDSIAMPGSETGTPALHQPKLTKVASAQEVMIKKRISIENYKQKASNSTSKPLFVKKRRSTDNKKQSLKLTEKECERFNFPKRISFDSDDVDDTSGDEDFLNEDKDNSLGLDDIYGDLAPRSPDKEMPNDNTPPVIIPIDPVKATIVNSKLDVDMRSLLSTPQLQPIPLPVPAPVPSPLLSPFGQVIPTSSAYGNTISEANIEQSKKDRISAMDPRTRRDLTSSVNSPNPYVTINPERTPIPALFPNIVSAPSMTPNRTPLINPSYMPSIPLLMTPNARSFEMTPSRQPFELEESSTRKHVYAPSFTICDNRERESSVSKDIPHWEKNKNDLRSGQRNQATWEDRDARSNFGQTEVPLTPRYEDSYTPKYDKYSNRTINDKYHVNRRDSYSTTDCPATPVPSFGWSECPSTPSNFYGRQDAPMTPSHPFGRSECPSTPSHPFGRSDCPTTPIHPFGRAECPPTPSSVFGRQETQLTSSHSYSRSECPAKPGHSFGRPEGPTTPSHPFGRSEYFGRQDVNQTYNKDPRLNRRAAEYEYGSYSERDREHQSERNYNRKSSSYKTQSHTSRNYDRETSGRNERHYSSDRCGRQYERGRRETSDGRPLSRDMESDRLYTRNRESRYDRRSRNYDDMSRRDQREKSIGRTSEDNINVRAQSISRASSVGRSSAKEKDNISLKSDNGRDLKINTSVKTTFQEFLASGKPIQVFDYSFDSRRQRAASVGRSLAHKSSVCDTVSNTTKSSDNYDLNKNDRFKRASSMGRELANSKTERSFQEVKADFESFKLKSDVNNKEKEKKNTDMDIETNKNKMSQSGRYKSGDIAKPQEKKNEQSKQTHIPPKKYRYIQKEYKEEIRKRYKIDRRVDSPDHKKSGIVYSSDNIAKGTIMGSGFGVKNYKIPKIKKVTEEPEEIIAKENTEASEISIDIKEDMSAKNENDKNTLPADTKDFSETEDDIIIKTNSKKRTENKLSENVIDLGTRITRSKKKALQSKDEENSCAKSRKCKKPVISDSDSETEKESIEKDECKIESKLQQSPKKTNKSKMNLDSITEKEELNKSKVLLDSTFAMDDMEIFPENIGSDPVIENINALIADLDKDLASSKISNESFETEIEHIMETINSPEGNSLGDISEIIEKDLNESKDSQQILEEKQNITTTTENLLQNHREELGLEEALTTAKRISLEPSLGTGLTAPKNVFSDITLSKIHEAIVSTTEIDPGSEKAEDNNIDTSVTDNDVKAEGSSVPDSTINKNASDRLEGLPDSTNDMHSELSSDVTSTNDASEIIRKDAEMQSSCQKETYNSIGSLLSILRDKSKIKELLSMLGGQSNENEKIKKKLEKLSEIVSDEEDDKVEKVDVVKDGFVDNQIANTAFPTNTENAEQISKFDPKHQIQQSGEKDAEVKIVSAEKISDENMNKPENIESIISEEVKETEEKISINDITSEAGTSDSLTSHNKEVHENSELSESGITKRVTEDVTKGSNKPIEHKDQDDDNDDEPLSKTKKKPTKKPKGKKGMVKLKSPNKTKPLTQFTPAVSAEEKPIVKKKMSRELQKLQEDIKEMFISDDILNATGIRMCRLAKMVTDNEDRKRDNFNDSEPLVVLEKVKGSHAAEQMTKLKKKPRQKQKSKALISQTSIEKSGKTTEPDTKMDKPKALPKSKSGPKCKTKQKGEEADPYDFDAESITDTNTTRGSDEDSSDSENESSASSRSFGSSEVLNDTKKKPKRKRRGTRGWQSGIIKQKNKKKKEQKQDGSLDDSPIVKPQKPLTIPDLDCFTDKNYCFQKPVSTYDCRLCVYSGTDIVNHYKKQHPHTEIPLSRMDPRTAEAAIQQCEEINFQAIIKVSSERYTCIFCLKEFGNSQTVLETFFWHIVSSHTGEFKHLCSECVNITRCPFNLDIPPPPKDGGQLIGYICGKCNFTQISLENLKTHVIVRHNDEQTEVYTINLALMSKKGINALMRRSESGQPRVLRSLRSNQSASDVRNYKDDQSDTTESSRRNSDSDSATPETSQREKLKVEPKSKPDRIKTKLTFENDEPTDETSVKMEEEEPVSNERDEPALFDDSFNTEPDTNLEIQTRKGNSDDIMDYPHFKLNYTDSGAKEYVCCINRIDDHYRTSLLISMKKHIQSKHSEKWDGYCFFCKVIVTLQGVQSDFKDCLAHFLDKHMDDIPVLEKETETASETILPNVPPAVPEVPTPAPPALSAAIPARVVTPPVERTASPSYIAVRPLAELISKELVKEIDAPTSKDDSVPFPKIENIDSLGEETMPPSAPSPVYPTTSAPALQPEKPFSYEEVQAEVMSKKHRVVLDGMMSKENLVRVFKCAGRFCSFTSDSAEDALMHASTHQRVGGEGALNCAYCNYDAYENGIDLVMHVFKEHSRCQYCCPLCFYRAAANQLVGAHYTKAHSGAPKLHKVLRSTAAVATPTPENLDVLSREIAVQHYICNHDEGACNFKTYTPGKFIEHLAQKHNTATSHPCNLCSRSFASAMELVMHQRCHGLKLYQCTWCVHGANNETELLAHAATHHPHCQPQAYVRVITNKDGSSQRRVLPLACLNKCKVPTEDIAPNVTKENPVREAERSIELEKLISHTMMIFDTSASQNTSNRSSPEFITDDISNEEPVELPTEILSDMQENESSELETLLMSTATATTTEKSTDSVTELSSLVTSTTTVVIPTMTETTSELNSMSTIENSAPLSEEPDSVGTAEKTSDETTQEVESVKSEPTELHKNIDGTNIISLDSDDEETSTIPAEVSDNPSPDNNTTIANGEVSRSSVTDEVSITKINSTNEVSITNTNETLEDSSSNVDMGQNIIDLSDDEPSIMNVPTVIAIIEPSFLFRCPNCNMLCKSARGFKRHVNSCISVVDVLCPHKPCTATITGINNLIDHYVQVHTAVDLQGAMNYCGVCNANFSSLTGVKSHMRLMHKTQMFSVIASVNEMGHRTVMVNTADAELLRISGRKTSTEKRYGIDPDPPSVVRPRKTSTEIMKRYGVDDIDKLPITPILDTQVFCELCEFGTKVRLNMVRHLQQHAGSMPVPRTQPVNPVPHLESNEKHFDKMLNLASSSILNRAPDKSARQESEPAVALMIPPGESSRYPKYVPERQRYTCGAKECAYISLDLAMFKQHWETLHEGAELYRCVHCPPNQALDTSIPLTATRIVSHLKMHDVSLYACSICSYYHHLRHMVEKHMSDVHKEGNVKVVREEYLASKTPVPQQPAMGAPTMDLKAWQCGLCKFSSMFRPEVVNHCGSVHQSKMQFKCAYCPFRTSTKDNVIKHQTNAHPNKVEEIFYYFYSEGSIPDDADGVPRWQKQRQKLGLDNSGVKTEPGPSETAANDSATLTPMILAPVATPAPIDLNLVKKEIDEPTPSAEVTIEDLCKKFGEFCDPDGIKYKCSLCNVVREHTKAAMQSHLYEELNYRRWQCGMCAYKGFHNTGLNEHMASEHLRQFAEPKALPVDLNIEKWVIKLLEHQSCIIETNRKNLAVQKIQVERVSASTPSPKKVDIPKSTAPLSKKVTAPNPTPTTSDAEFQQAFGEFGAPKDSQFCCPKCDFMTREETDMRYHLESELTKIRWGCTICENKFQTFHEAQFHCKSMHIGQSSRPKEAIRDPSLRQGWVLAVIATQRKAMTSAFDVEHLQISDEDSDPNENSLLVARYDKPVATEEQIAIPAKRPAAPVASDENAVSVEPPKKKYNERQCPYCDYTSTTPRCVKEHICRHYNIKPYKCGHCSFDGTRFTVISHIERQHPGLARRVVPVQIPEYIPSDTASKSSKRDSRDQDDATKTVCLYCEKSVPETEIELHTHGNEKLEFAKRGELVVKCCKCLVLCLNVTSLQEHFDLCHPGEKFNYAYFKLQVDTREILCCGHCYKKFKFLRDLKAHHVAMHMSLVLAYTSIPFNHNLHTEDADGGKRKLDDGLPGPSTKRVARKSTSKLPMSSVAKKSTTKLPASDAIEYSFYGTKPLSFENYSDVTVNIPMFNRMVDVNVEKLNRIEKIDPRVVIRDCQS